MLAVIAFLLLASLGYGGVYGTLGVAAVGAACLAVVCAAVAWGPLGARVQACLLAALGMLAVANLIQAAQGRSETHFAVFVFLAFTLVYRDWRVVLVAAVTVALHHLSFNLMQQLQWGPVCFAEPSLLRVLEHAAYVVVQAGFLMVIAAQQQRQWDTVQAMNVAMTRKVQDLSEATQAMARATSSMQAVYQSLERSNRSLQERSVTALRDAEEAVASAQLLVDGMQSNARDVSQAQMIVQHAKVVADETSGVTSQAVQSMESISQSSRRIGDIISVIDGIAFQTNILALNAAVEAARAGEHGRGFAVVASEVRSLSQRSAKAAQEIKELITEALREIDHGVALVHQAGHKMGEVGGEVGRVSGLMEQVVAGITAQSQAMRQLQEVVQTLDDLARQGQAQVEDNHHSAQALGQGIDALQDIVLQGGHAKRSVASGTPASAPRGRPALPA